MAGYNQYANGGMGLEEARGMLGLDPALFSSPVGYNKPAASAFNPISTPEDAYDPNSIWAGISPGLGNGTTDVTGTGLDFGNGRSTSGNTTTPAAINPVMQYVTSAMVAANPDAYKGTSFDPTRQMWINGQINPLYGNRALANNPATPDADMGFTPRMSQLQADVQKRNHDMWYKFASGQIPTSEYDAYAGIGPGRGVAVSNPLTSTGTGQTTASNPLTNTQTATPATAASPIDYNAMAKMIIGLFGGQMGNQMGRGQYGSQQYGMPSYSQPLYNSMFNGQRRNMGFGGFGSGYGSRFGGFGGQGFGGY